MDTDTGTSTADRIIQSIDSRWSDDLCASLAQASIGESLDAFDTQLGEVGRTMQAAEQAIRRLRFHRNRSCAVNRLPVETLRAIFESASHCGAYEAANKAITHVCSYWRTIAVNDPQLWTTLAIDSITKTYAEVSDIRSQGLPLHVVSRHKGFSIDPPEWIIDLIARNLHRVKVLRISPSMSILNLLLGAAPALAEFSLQSGLRYPGTMWNLKLFRGHTPALRALVLREFWVPSSAGTYRNLTKLDIVAEGLHPVTTEDVRVICRENPGLEFLRLHFGRGKDQNFLMPGILPEDDPRRTTMPNLHHLSLRLRIELIAQLLSTMHFTQQPNQVDIKAYSDRGDYIETLFTPRCMSTLFFQRLHTIHVENDPSCLLRLQGSSTHSEAGDCAWTVEWKLSGEVVTPCDFEVVAATIVNSQPMPLLQSFRIKDFVEDPRDSSPAALTNFVRGATTILACSARSITTFEVHAWRCPGDWTSDFHPTSTIFETIHDRLSTLDDQTQSESLLPLLETCTFSIQSPDNDPGQHSCEDFMHIVPIVRLLNANVRRLEIGGAGHLAISSNDTAIECVRRVQELAIPEMYWDMVRFWPKAPLNTEDMEAVTGCFWPRDIWPEGEAYTWRCTREEKRGRHEGPDSFCCGLEGLAE